MSKSTTIRCAIYTRKSSDEGLDQAFNSLDAQREAGEAYIKSQASEGWKVIPALYDDGGYSGGTMERPALQRLLADIEAGLVDVVVVYKIDRLTRALADFARIIERFDAREVSFVSVTQAFNTTTSMGRLTLNVLLSFAQFEREVTGERIRDKIAASKKKGMWMGGKPPLGYDPPAPGTRKLVVSPREAETIRHIYTRYLELGSVHALERDLEKHGIRSKQWVTAAGKPKGGAPISRGSLFHLLRNRIYRGEIPHKGEVHPGEHEAIVDAELFARVQRQLSANARRHHAAADHRVARAPLVGKLTDATGEIMSPAFSRGASGRAYRYYVSASLQQGAAPRDDGVVQRIAAPAIEGVVGDTVSRWLGSPAEPFTAVLAVRLAQDAIMVDLPGHHAADLASRLEDGERIVHAARDVVRLSMSITLPLRGGRRQIVAGQRSALRPDPTLISALRKAHRMIERERGLPFVKAAPVSPYDRRIMRLAFLAPDLQRDILVGQQPATLNLAQLMGIEIPLAWDAQREALGWHVTG